MWSNYINNYWKISHSIIFFVDFEDQKTIYEWIFQDASNSNQV